MEQAGLCLTSSENTFAHGENKSFLLNKILGHLVHCIESFALARSNLAHFIRILILDKMEKIIFVRIYLFSSYFSYLAKCCLAEFG